MYGPVGARAGTQDVRQSKKVLNSAPEASVGACPAAADGPALWTERGFVAQGRLNMTPINIPTDPRHHQGS